MAQGPLVRATEPIILKPTKAPAVTAQPATGHTLKDCLEQWKVNRTLAKKRINTHHTHDVENVFVLFREHSSVDDIGQVTRKHVIAFRDHIAKEFGYKAGTLNKKIGYLLTASKIAAGAGWIAHDLGSGYYIETPEDEDQRESYTGEQLKTIFGHKLFTDGWRPKSVKALGEFGFWFPLISATHGMITSEVLQLGPDTVGPHPDAKDIMCMTVTTPLPVPAVASFPIWAPQPAGRLACARRGAARRARPHPAGTRYPPRRLCGTPMAPGS